jgi:hypothetical protein
MTSDTFTDWRKATYSHGNGACMEVAATWRKSTYSHGNSDCVEVAAGRRVVGVRDTIQRGRGPVLEFSAAAWRDFIGSAKSRRT